MSYQRFTASELLVRAGLDDSALVTELARRLGDLYDLRGALIDALPNDPHGHYVLAPYRLRRDLITGDAKAAALELRAMAEVYIDGY